MKKNVKIAIGCVIIAVCCVVAAITLLQPTVVEVETLTPGALNDTFTAQGTVTPEKSLVLNSVATGTIQQMPFKVGDSVDAGDSLVIVTPGKPMDIEVQKEQVRQQLASAKEQYNNLYGANGQATTALAAAESAYNLAKLQYESAKTIEAEASGTYSKANLFQLKSAMEQAKQSLLNAQQQNSATSKAYYRSLINSSEAQLAALQKGAGGGILKAPFEGVIWQILTDEGAYVTKDQPIIKIYQGNNMKIEASLLSEDALKLEVGGKAECELSDGTVLTTSIKTISPVAEQVVSSIGLEENRCTVQLIPKDLPKKIGAGYEVDLIFTASVETNVLSVPASAIVPQADGSSAVYLIKGKAAALTIVETGLRSGGRVQLISGAETGNVVITNPYDTDMKNGRRVKANLK